MPQWLWALAGPISAVVIVIVFLIMLRKEIMLRRELKRQSERDDEIWYTTGSPMVWTQDLANHLED